MPTTPAAPPAPRPLLKPEDACELLGVSIRTLTRLTKAGDLPAIKLGRSVRYTQADLEALIARRRQEGAGHAE